jgi:hypothetical protein
MRQAHDIRYANPCKIKRFDQELSQTNPFLILKIIASRFPPASPNDELPRSETSHGQSRFSRAAVAYMRYHIIIRDGGNVRRFGSPCPGEYLDEAEEFVIRMNNATQRQLIAPCGINCNLCRAFQREKNKCPGCRDDRTIKLKTCVTCRIKNCSKLTTGRKQYCFACTEFPCERLKHLDKRYRRKYGTSVIENLLCIKNIGINKFIKSENKKWKCPECGGIICMHKPDCVLCGYTWNK